MKYYTKSRGEKEKVLEVGNVLKVEKVLEVENVLGVEEE